MDESQVMNMHTEKLPNEEVGRRLRIAREAVKLTQAECAKALGMSRTTIVAIEQGKRRIRINELQILAALYGSSANAILRHEAVHLDFVPRFYKLPNGGDRVVGDAARLLNDLVRAELELENALGIQRNKYHPRENPILSTGVHTQAEQDAQDLRGWLGLGSGAVGDVLSILELQIGIRIYLRNLDPNIAGLFAYDEAPGTCMLLNSRHPDSLLRQIALHGLGHFSGNRREPGILYHNRKATSREERYADSFARSFLMPARAIRQKFAETTAGQSFFTRKHVFILAREFRVSRETMTRRLEELFLIREGSWDWFVSHDLITCDQERMALRIPTERQIDQPGLYGIVPDRLGLLICEAWIKGLYSEGQLAQMLRLSRPQVRQILDNVELEESEADGFFQLSH